METIHKDIPAEKRRKFDKPFKCEVVRNWLSNGKSAAVLAKELGLRESRLFAWRQRLPLPTSSPSSRRPGGRSAICTRHGTF